MRVLFVQRQPCIRALKYAVGLRATQPSISLAFAYQGKTLSGYYGSGDELFDRWWDLGPDESPVAALSAVIDEFAPDVIHSHNLPDTLTVVALEVAGAIPVVHDIHDLQRLRKTPYRDGFPEPSDPLALERAAIEESGAVVTVSQELVDVIDAVYDLPSEVRIVPNYALGRDLVPDLPVRTGAGPLRLVYQGSLASDGGHYDLRDHMRQLVSDGFELHVHPSGPATEYRAMAAELPNLRVHESLSPRALLRVLPSYDLGIATFNDSLNSAHLDTVLPNKLFEYLGSGLPVVTLRAHRALARFVETEGVGIVLDNLSELRRRLADTDQVALYAAVAAARHRFTFESVAGDVAQLYRRLISARGVAPLVGREPSPAGGPGIR